MTDSRDHQSKALGSTSSGTDALGRDDTDKRALDTSNDNPGQRLVRMLETEILPRLMLVHKYPQNDNHLNRSTAEEIGPEQVDDLVQILFDQSVTAGHEYVESALQRGVELERIYMNLLAPAARVMGELWESDAKDFSDVTIGLCRLHEILRHHNLQPSQTTSAQTPDRLSIMLTTACGDQHVFGVIMVAEFFRKAGWLVISEPGASTNELSRIVASRHYDIIGLSIARSLSVKEITDAITQLRIASINKDVKIIIGGALLERRSLNC